MGGFVYCFGFTRNLRKRLKVNFLFAVEHFFGVFFFGLTSLPNEHLLCSILIFELAL